MTQSKSRDEATFRCSTCRGGAAESPGYLCHLAAMIDARQQPAFPPSAIQSLPAQSQTLSDPNVSHCRFPNQSADAMSVFLKSSPLKRRGSPTILASA